MKKSIVFIAVVFTCMSTTATVFAQTVSIHFDPSQSKVLWTLPDVLHTVHGTFQLASGNVLFNPQTGAASGLFTVQEDTGQSGDSVRDNRMKKSVLVTAKYPIATFQPTHVAGPYTSNGSSNLAVAGILHLYGADHPMQLNFQVKTADQVVTATTKFEVPYVAWGMHDPSTLFLRVDKSVQMEMDAKGTIQISK